MRVRPFAWVGIVSLLAVGAAGAEDKPAAGELRLGMLQGMFRDVSPAVVTALAKPFRDLMLKQTGYAGDVEVFDDPLALAEKMRDKKVDVGVFHGFEFAWAQQSCDDLVPLIVTMPPGGKVQAVLVVRQDNPAKTLADLKGEPVTIPRGAKAHSLAFLAKQRAGYDKSEAKPVTKAKETPEDVLNAVAAGDVAVALVDVCALDGYEVLQPGQFRQLRVLQRSEAFPQAVIAYRKGALGEEEAGRIRTGLTSATKTPSGKLLMTLWNLKGFEEPPADYQGSLDAILKAYPCPVKGESRISAKEAIAPTRK